MNKQKFVDFLRQPESISDSSLAELEHLVSENPYFHSAHTVIARASRLLKDRKAARKVNTAAIYATSRKALKKYIQGDLVFGEQIKPKSPPVEEQASTTTAPVIEETTRQESAPSKPVTEPLKAAPALSQTDHDSLIDEVYENIEEWKKSRNHFLDYELSLEDSGSTKAKEEVEPETPAEERPAKPASAVDKIKSQIAEEIIAEEEEVEEAMKVIKKKGAKDKKDTKKTKAPVVTESDKIVDEEVEKEGEEIPEKDIEDSSEESLKISKEKEGLKLSPGNKGGKKFRLNILNRPSPKSKIADKSTKSKETKATSKKSTETKSTAKSKTADTKVKATPEKKAAAKPKAATTKKKTASTKAKPKGTTKAKSTTGKTKKSDSKDDEKKKPKETQGIAKKKDFINEQVDLIDKFISTNPSIEPGKIKSGEGSVIDLSEKSREFPPGIVTENMARIFESQGKTENAISIYEKLILKNPEKKSYFATRIKNLKNN
ncbi:MAG: hypothetical protein RIG77_15520 [Cyclobacteriaceae bacterium]